MAKTKKPPVPADHDYVTMRHGLTLEQPIVSRYLYREEPDAGFHDMHFTLEIGIVLRGEMRREWPGHSLTLGPGQTWLCGMWEPHGYAVETLPCEIIVLIIHPAHIAALSQRRPNFFRMFTSTADRRPAMPSRFQPDAIRVGRRLVELHKEPHPLKSAWQSHYLHELLLFLAEDQPASGTESSETAADYLRIQPALEHVFTHREFISGHDAAHACGLSRTRFDQIFKNVMGETFARFALRHRIHGAAHQLATTTAPVKTVAWEWGFTDSSHLHAQMQKHFGLTPGEYRRKHRIKGYSESSDRCFVDG